MTLRLRLALCYGGLTGIAVSLACAYSFAVHSRAHYEQLDASLRSAAEHITGELARATNSAQRDDVLVAASHLGVAASLVRLKGTALEVLPAPHAATRDLPVVDLEAMLRAPSLPAYPAIAALAPAEHRSARESYTLAVIPAARRRGKADTAGVHTGRWRVLLLAPHAERPGLVITTPLMERDRSVVAFGQVMLSTAVVGTLVSFLMGWTIAGRALRPVAALTEAAAEIADSRALHRRVPSAIAARRGVPAGPASQPTQEGRALAPDTDPNLIGDELDRLAATLNRMLDSLQEAHAGQERFVADASHELRAPLSAVAANLELLGRTLDAADRTVALDEARQATRRLGTLVADLLTLARTDAAAPLAARQLALAEVANEAVCEARGLAEGRRIELVARAEARIAGDFDELVRLVLILLDNALKFSPHDTRVTLAVAARHGRVELVVTDAGPGIPPEALPFVFDRFYRADTSRARRNGGAGLGLSIAKRIVERHHGTIRIENLPHGGAQASVSFPAVGDRPARDPR